MRSECTSRRPPDGVNTAMRAEDHRRLRALLGAYTLGLLDDPELVEIECHLVECAQCRAEREYLRPVPRYLDLLGVEDVDALQAGISEGKRCRCGYEVGHWRRRIR